MKTRYHSILFTAARNARYYLRYTIGAVLAVGMSFMSLTLFRCYMIDIDRTLEYTWGHRSMLGHILIESRGKTTLSPDDQFVVETFIRNHSSKIDVSARFLIGQGQVVGPGGSTVFLARGYDLANGTALRGSAFKWDARAGKPLYLSSNSDDVLIGRGLASMMNCSIGPTSDLLTGEGYPSNERPFKCPQGRLTLKATTKSNFVNSIDVNVLGIADGYFRDLDNRLVLASLETLQSLLDTKDVTYFAIQLSDPSKTDELLRDFGVFAHQKQVDLKATKWQDHPYGDLYHRTNVYLIYVRNFIATILLILSGLSVFAAFIKLVDERTREIGTTRAIGFHDSYIVMSFAAEAAMIALIATIVGTTTSLFASAIINYVAVPYYGVGLTEPIHFRVAIDLGVYGSTALCFMAISVIGAVVAMRSKIASSVVHNLTDAGA